MGGLSSPLNAICDADTCAGAGWDLVDFAEACLQGGATFLQIRAKAAASGWLLDVCTRVVRRAAAAGAQVIVNDRADIARMSGAGGVHVGQDDLPPRAVRRVIATGSVVGLSTHTLEELENAVAEPIDYVAVGPVFQTLTKNTGRAAVGLERVTRARTIAGAAGLPVVAIGGITLETARQVIEAGASSVAVISDLLATGDPERRVKEYLRVFFENPVP